MQRAQSAVILARACLYLIRRNGRYPLSRTQGKAAWGFLSGRLPWPGLARHFVLKLGYTQDFPSLENPLEAPLLAPSKWCLSLASRRYPASLASRGIPSLHARSRDKRSTGAFASPAHPPRLAPSGLSRHFAPSEMVPTHLAVQSICLRNEEPRQFVSCNSFIREDTRDSMQFSKDSFPFRDCCLGELSCI